MRYFIKFAYNGTFYHGWQYQPNAISVQEVLNKALSLLCKEDLDIVGAGRTDAGVHAKMMYAHFDTNEELDTVYMTQKLNSFLPKDIVIYDIIPVENEAHARFDAVSRTYNYHIHTFKDAFNNHLSWYYSHPLAMDIMNDAAQILLEYNDFECFSKTHTDVFTFNCKITEAFWTRDDHNLCFTITADRFLRNMVRAIVGTLINVGLEKITLDDFRNIIESKNRNKAGFSVPAHGLFLTHIQYPYIP